MSSNQPHLIKQLDDFLQIGEKVVIGLKEQMKIPLVAEPGDPDFQLRDLNGNPKRISDITDEEGKYQYVNLVQEGGGMLGIALIGYIYVLERMGIRFLKLAGTSAGSIISMMLAIIRPASQNTLKSPIMLYYLLDKNLFEFVDGNPIAQWLIKSVIESNNSNSDDPYIKSPKTEPTGRGKPYQNFLVRLANSTISLLLMLVLLIATSSLLLWQDSESFFRLGLGVVIALMLCTFLFRQESFNLKALGDYFYNTGWKIIVAIVSFLLICEGLLVPESNQPLQLFLELAPLLGLTLYSVYLAYQPTHMRFIQLLVAVVLGIEFISGILNKVLGIKLDLRALPCVWRWVDIQPESMVYWLFTKRNPQPPYFFLSSAGIALLMVFGILIGSVSLFLTIRFNDNHFGINPGKNFEAWLTKLLKNGAVASPANPIKVQLASGKHLEICNEPNGIENLRQFEKQLIKNQPKLKYVGNDPNNNDISDLIKYDPNNPFVTFITAEVVTQNKIELPRMWNLFWRSPDFLNPASFVRASMSIPVFFEPYRVKNIPKRQEGQQDKRWKDLLGFKGSIPDDAIFLDGGTLSNFPINLFYKPGLDTPRMPTFGIRLRDSNDDSSTNFSSLWKLLYSMFNNARYYYDKDFMINHPMYDQCIGEIDVRSVNWLDFNMPLEKQKDLFCRGAVEAAEFLRNFDWERYKVERAAARL